MADFESCFRKLYPTLCVFAFQYLKDNRQSEDIVQDAFMKLWDRYPSFDQFYKIKAFLYIAVRNNAINILQHARIESKHGAFLSEENERSETGFESAIIDSETNRLLYQAIDMLPPQTRKIITLAMEDKTNREIAEALGISTDTVKTLKKRAYKMLREKLSDNYFLSLILFINLFL